MRIINQMPFTECERCRRCIISIKDSIGINGRTIFVTCRNAKKCLNRKKKGENKNED